MDMLDFTNYLSTPDSEDLFEKQNIKTIYAYIKNKKIFDLLLFLSEFQEGLISYYKENEKIVGGFPPVESANIFFSQFLQHLFCYVLQEIEDSSIATIFLKAILNGNSNSFYYHTYEETGEITLWVDPNSGETALISACEQSNAEVVELLLENLKNMFKLRKDNLAPEFEYYLAHGNNEGFSALGITWFQGKKAIADYLFNLAEEYYGDPSTEGFRRFLFQIDTEGRSVFMRAIERKNTDLVLFLVEKFHELAGIYDEALVQHVFFHQDQLGESILHKVVRVQPTWLAFFLYQSIQELGRTSDKFGDFLLLSNKEGATAFLLASQQGNREMLDLLFRFAVKNDVSRNTATDLFTHQDNQGYTALMRAAEAGYIKGVKYLLNSWLSINYCPEDCDALYHTEEIFSGLALQSREGYSILQLAAKQRHWEVLSHLLDSLERVSTEDRRTLMQTINYALDSDDNLLTCLYREEAELMQSAYTEHRLLTIEETEASQIRLALANKLVIYNFRSSVRPSIASWQFISSGNWPRKIANFFSIFCTHRRHDRHRRTIDLPCTFLERSYQTSISEASAHRYKESLIHLMAVFTQQHIDSLVQVSHIRNNNKQSVREQVELERFDQAVTHYYERYGSAILDEIKQISVSSLEAAFAADATHIIVDGGNNLLVLTQDKQLYSPVLNVETPIPLVSEINFGELNAWLMTYFSPSYTLHPVNLESRLQHYPLVLTELTQPIISDVELLNRSYEGVRGETLRRLFLLSQKSIDLEKLTDANFVGKYGSSLSFRAETFHALFFHLSIREKEGLVKIFTHHVIYPANYEFLSKEENRFLTNYGLKIIYFLLEKSSYLASIHASNLLKLVIDTYESLFLDEDHLSSLEMTEVIDSFRRLKNSLTVNLEGKYHAKAALQLLLFLLPSAVQAIANKESMELVIPVSLIAADTLLRASLLRLINHPQIIQILDSQFSRKVSQIISQGVERVPIIGTTLAVYGLIKSGKALATTSENDPNRPYYAHLFINHLATVGLMGTEVAVSLPFWPVLALFAVLTADQVITEGSRLHDVVFHLQDDKNHPLLTFYRETKLGLGIIDDGIQLMMEQRELFHNFLGFLEARQRQYPVDMVAAALPAVRPIDSSVESQERALGCAHSVETRDPRSHPQTSSCHRDRLVIDKKDNYAFELGKTKTFCERRDPFYDPTAMANSNLTLWIGTLSPNCELGQEITAEGVAESTGAGVAALLVNTQEKQKIAENSTLFLPIDTDFVGTFSFKLMRNTDEIASHSVKHELSCDKPIAECIKKITVMLAPLYGVLPTDRRIKTQLIITDDELRNPNDLNQGIQTIEYLIAKSSNLTIHPNQIPQQIFSFVNDNQHLHVENNLLQSNDDFQMALAHIKQLTLLFSNTTQLTGSYMPTHEQQLTIRPLQGEAQERDFVLDIRQCRLCAVSLIKNVSILTKSLAIQVLGNFSNPVLEINSDHKNSDHLYRLLKPMNAWIVNYNKDKLLNLYCNQTSSEDTDSGNIILVGEAPIDKTISVTFSGTYLLNGQVCFSRLFMRKSSHGDWECDLEINAVQVNDTSNFRVSDLQKHHFNKISILTSNESDVKITHYLFYPSQATPFVNGKFIDYQLKTSEEGWLLILKHKHDYEETHCFLAEDAEEIIIEAIRYEIKPASAALFALSAVDNKTLDASQLIASLKIDKPFSETEITLHAPREYQIDTLRLINFSHKDIYFADQHFPLNFLQSILLLKAPAAVRKRRSMTQEKNKEERILDIAHDYLDHYERLGKGAHGQKAIKKISKSTVLHVTRDKKIVSPKQPIKPQAIINQKPEIRSSSVKNIKKQSLRSRGLSKQMASPVIRTQEVQAKNSQFFITKPAFRSIPSSSMQSASLYMNKDYKKLPPESSTRLRITDQYSGSYTKKPASSVITPTYPDVQATLFAMNFLVRRATGEKYKPRSPSQDAAHKKMERQNEKIKATTSPYKYGKNSSQYLGKP